MTKTRAFAALSPGQSVEPLDIDRRDLRADDVAIDILYCGICHTDLHMARNDWGHTTYPFVPGHEIVGKVAAIGSSVSKHKVGDMVAVGCMVDSCRVCAPCKSGEEHYCANQFTGTYGGHDRHDGTPTYGGYSESIVVSEDFVLRVPKGLDPERAGPVLCAGVTAWSALRHSGVGPNSRVAVAGLGGIGHMAVKLAAGLGAHVVVVTTSENKRADAMALGAADVLISTDEAAMGAAMGQFDVVIDTIPVQHNLSPYLMLTGLDGRVVVLGMIDMVPSFHSGIMMMGRRVLTASAIGSIAETQEVLDFCAEKGLNADCETIPVSQIETAFERMEKSDVKYRFVIDMATID